MKYYIIAGEASGEMHAANLLQALRQEDAQAQFRGIGGERMQAQGLELHRHYKALAYMGFVEVLAHLGTLRRAMQACKTDIRQFQPDVVVLVDYAGFNLRIARFCQKAGFRVYYYISPKIWAWNRKRGWKIKRLVDRMFCILPFEVDFYQQFGVEVDFVGNPVYDAVDRFRPSPDFKGEEKLPEATPLIAVLPGSRRSEVEKNLQIMLEVAARFPQHQLVVAAMPQLEEGFYRQVCQQAGIPYVMNRTYDLLAHSEAAIVASGTAALETALFEVPQLVCYKMAPLNFWVGKQVVKVSWVSLVNLVLNRGLLKELLQDDFTPENVAAELAQILEGERRREILQGYSQLKGKLGGPGASEATARKMVAYLHEKSSI